jgi:hypothetical protein
MTKHKPRRHEDTEFTMKSQCLGDSVARLRKALLSAAGVVAFVAPVAVGGQNPPSQARDLPAAATLPSFEEASIRPNVTEGRGGRGGQFQPTRWVSQNVTLKTILKNTFARQGAGGPNTALPLLDSQVIGGPDWLDTDKFDIVATTPADAADAAAAVAADGAATAAGTIQAEGALGNA